MNTDKRQLRLTISEILQAQGIDDLALEARLTDAVCTFFDEAKSCKDPVKTRKDILAGMLEYKSKYSKYEATADRIAQIIRVTPDGSDAWAAVVRFVANKDDLGEHLEAYAEWMSRDPYNSPKLHQIAQNPRLIISTWPAAFAPSNDGFNPQGLTVEA